MPASWIRCWREHLGALGERVESAARRRGCGPSSTSTRWCARSTGTPSRAPPTGIPRSLVSRCLRKGLSPLVTTISTDIAPPVITGIRLRAGQDRLRAGCGPHGRRGDRHRPRGRGERPDHGARRRRLRKLGAVIRVCRRYGAGFSLVLTRNSAVQGRHRGHRRGRLDTRCTIPARCEIPTPAPGSLMPRSPRSPTPLVASGTKGPVTARLIVRRVKDAAQPADGLFPLWRYHPFFTNNTEPARRCRHHPPPPRHHRNRLRRSDRWTPGPHPF